MMHANLNKMDGIGSAEKDLILIIDDEKISSSVLEGTIEKIGFKGKIARSFTEAEKLLHTQFFSAILCDIFLERENGLELLKLAGQIQPNTPVILITGHPSVETVADGLRQGAYDYLCKPVNLKTLLNTVTRAVELKKLREEGERLKVENQKYQINLETMVKEKTEKLKQSGKRFRTLFEYSKDPMFTVNKEGKIDYINQATIDLFEYSREEMRGINFAELYAHSNDIERFQQILKQSGSIKDFEAELLKKNGTAIEALLTARIMKDSVGQIIEYQCILRDVTPNKRAADKIRKQEKFLKSAIDSLSHPFIVIDATDHKVIIANSAARIYDISNKKACYELTHGFSKPCSGSGHRCTLEEIKNTNKPVRVEHEHLDKDGNVRNFEIHGYPIFDNEGKVVQIIQYTLDITERKRAELESHRLGTAIKQSADSIVITDPNGIIQYVNPAFETVTGYKMGEVIGKTPRLLNSGHHNAKYYKRMWDTIRDGNIWHGQFINKKKDGTLFNEEATISPVKDDHGKIINFVAIKRDVTEKNRLESIAEASNLMDNLGYIFSGIRHEIGNPVNSIKMALTILNKNLKSYSKKKIEELVTRALDDVSRVEYLLKALKNFSLFERPDIQKVQIYDFIQNFLSLVKKDIEKKRIRIKTRLSSDAVWGYTDPRALHQVLLNLLTNAVDALGERKDKQITVCMEKVSDLIQIQIVDNGCGLSEEESQNLFKPFYTSKAHGTGLGLVIVKKMLTCMDSSIRIESKYKTETTATIWLPGSQT